MRKGRKNISMKMWENIVLGSHVFLVMLNINDCTVQLLVTLSLPGRKAVNALLRRDAFE